MRSDLRMILGLWALLWIAIGAGVAGAAEEDVSAVVDAYWAAYEARDFETLGSFYTPESVFRDPTFAYAGRGLEPIEVRGGTAITAFLEEAAASTLDLELEVDDRFFVGPLVVLEGTYRAQASGDALGISGKTLEFTTAFVTVLRVEDGKVHEHLEYNEYPAAREQYLAQGGTAETLAAMLGEAPLEPAAPARPTPDAAPSISPSTPRAPAPPRTEPGRPPRGGFPAIELENVERLAVIPFVTDGEVDEELSFFFSERLRRKRTDLEVFTTRELVSYFEGRPSDFDSEAPLELLLDATYLAGAQAVVVGEAVSYEAEGDDGIRLRLEIYEVQQGQKIWEDGGWGTSFDPESAKRRAIVDTVRKMP